MKSLHRQFYLIAISLPFLATSVHQVIAVNLVAVGGGGTIRQSPDSGGNWYIRSSGTINGLIAIDCVLDNCWVVGDGGTILQSNDAGVTWAAQSSGTVQSLEDVDFLDSNTGWAVGGNGTILKTTNGGMSWSPQESNTPGVQFRSVFALSGSKAWITGQYDAIRHTTDGGINWSFQTPAHGTQIQDIYFNSSSNGVYVVDNGPSAGITDNGGATWTPADTSDLPQTLTNVVRAVDFVDSEHGWLAGDYGLLGITTDGGETWTRSMSVGTNASFFGISMVDHNRGWIVGISGTIRKTIDGGQSWAGQSSGTTQTLFDIIAVQSPQYPDFDGDGDVDERDFLVWQRGYGSPEGATFELGDASGDGRVDSADLEMWQANYGVSQGSILSVPEPGILLVMPIGYLIIISARLKQFRRS